MKGLSAGLRLFALSLVVALSVGVNHADEVSPLDGLDACELLGLTPCGNADDVSPLDRFGLFNSCEPMGVMVEGLDSDAAEIWLTEESLRTAVESRLRSARLYDDHATTVLYLNVNLFGRAFRFDLEYRRFTCPSGFGCGWATTWDSGGIGTHGANAGYIRSAVVEHMDTFLVEYLKVNEEACSGD